MPTELEQDALPMVDDRHTAFGTRLKSLSSRNWEFDWKFEGLCGNGVALSDGDGKGFGDGEGSAGGPRSARGKLQCQAQRVST